MASADGGVRLPQIRSPRNSTHSLLNNSSNELAEKPLEKPLVLPQTPPRPLSPTRSQSARQSSRAVVVSTFFPDVASDSSAPSDPELLHMARSPSAPASMSSSRALLSPVMRADRLTAEEIYRRSCKVYNVTTPIGKLSEKLGQRELVMNHRGLGNDGVSAICVCLTACENIRELSFTYNKISDKGLDAVAAAVKQNTAITVVDLSNNDIEGGIGLLELIKCPTLRRLSLSSNLIRDGISDAITRSFLPENNPRTASDLLHLDLSRNRIGHSFANAFGNALRTCCFLRSIDLSWTTFGYGGLMALISGMKYNASLRRISLVRCGIGTDVSGLVGDLVLQSDHIEELDLAHNRIDHEGIKPICLALKGNVSLRKLGLEGNPLGAVGWEALLSALTHNETLEEVNIRRTIAWSSSKFEMDRFFEDSRIVSDLHQTHRSMVPGGVNAAFRPSRVWSSLDAPGQHPSMASRAFDGLPNTCFKATGSQLHEPCWLAVDLEGVEQIVALRIRFEPQSNTAQFELFACGEVDNPLDPAVPWISLGTFKSKPGWNLVDFGLSSPHTGRYVKFVHIDGSAAVAGGGGPEPVLSMSHFEVYVPDDGSGVRKKFKRGIALDSTRQYSFLIDKSGSMQIVDPHHKLSRWEETRQAILALVKVCLKMDENGVVDVFFFGDKDNDEYHSVKNENDLDKRFNTLPNEKTFLAKALRSAINHFPLTHEHTICILTDGEANDRDEIKDVIVKTALQIGKLGIPLSNSVSIAFIQVGEDPGARDYLRHLDEDLESATAGIDIVDMTTFEQTSRHGLLASIQNALMKESKKPPPR